MSFGKVIIGMGVVAMSMSGCTALALKEKADKFQALENRVDALANTGATDMPTGSATYTGGAAFAGVAAGKNVAVVGDAELTANFDAGTITGTATDFYGATLTDAQKTKYDNGTLSVSDFISLADDATGTVRIQSGAITGSTFVATTSGTLKMDNDTIGVSGGITGQFKGTQASALTATDGPTFGMTVNGVAATSVEASVKAEKD